MIDHRYIVFDLKGELHESEFGVPPEHHFPGVLAYSLRTNDWYRYIGQIYATWDPLPLKQVPPQYRAAVLLLT
jgi:hypothetical protein